MKGKYGVKLATLALLLSILFSANAVQAEALGYACNGCNEAQRLQLARTFPPGDSAGIFYIYDWNAGTIYQYQTRKDRTGNPYAVFLGETPSAIETRNDYNNIRAAVAQNGGSTVFNNYEDTTDPFLSDRSRNATGYEFGATSQVRNDFILWLSIKYIPSPTREGVMGYLYKILLNENPLSATILVVLKDGSKITFEKKDKVITISQATDPNNNSIPLKEEDAPGRYNFGPDGDISGFLEFMKDRYGYTIPSGIPVCSTGHKVACTSGNGVKTCQVISTCVGG